MSEDLVGPPPADGLVDRAGLGHRNAALVAKLREDIRQLRDDHGFQLYVLLESVLVSGDPQLLASRLRRNWIPKGDGMVLVFEMDTRSLGIGQSFEQEADPTKAPPGQVPSYETNLILEKARMNVDAASAESMLETFAAQVVDGYNEYFLRKNQPVPGERSVKMGLIIVGGAAALALLGLMAALLVRRSDNRGGGRCFYFPDVQVSERLGAPYGGGEVSSRRFGTGARS
ncbi:MAG: TPM domain-containing protein [Akkermansiaceae bacterium]|nr:TPM domain-containing protein [Akkermansiaceae bacterium]